MKIKSESKAEPKATEKPIVGPVKRMEYLVWKAKKNQNPGKNKANKKSRQLVPTASTAVVVDSTAIAADSATLKEKLRSAAVLTEGELQQLFKYGRERSDEFVRLLEQQIPSMSEDSLVHTIQFAKKEIEGLWHLQALCVAQAFSRCPRIKVGRGYKDSQAEGREAVAKELANKFGISVTTIRTDLRIMETFGLCKETKKSTETPAAIVGVSVGATDYEISAERTGDGEEGFFTEMALTTQRSATIRTWCFQPHPALTKQHYAVASRCSSPWGQKHINDAITRIQAGENYPAAEMERRLFSRKNTRVGHFDLRPDTGLSDVVHLEMTFDKSDAGILYEILGAEFGMVASSGKEIETILSRSRNTGFAILFGILRKHWEEMVNDRKNQSPDGK